MDENNLDRLNRWMIVGLFAALGAYIWICIRPELIYFTFGTYSNYPVFETGWSFLRLNLSLSGGLITYIGAFLSQTFIVSWLGAAAMIGVCGLLYAAIIALPLSIRRFPKQFVGWVAVILAGMMWQQYDHPMNLVLALTTNIWMAVAIIRFQSKPVVFRIVGFAVSMALMYWWTGAVSIVFGILLVIHVVVDRGRILEGLSFGILGIAVLWGFGRWIFYLEFRHVWTILSPFHPAVLSQLKPLSRICAQLVVVFVPAMYLTACLWQQGSKRRRSVVHHSRHNKKEPPRRGWFITAVCHGLPWIVLVAMAAGGLEYSRRINRTSDTHPLILQAGSAARTKRWNDVLDIASQFKRKGAFHRILIHDVCRALYHLGQMGDRMFEFPQDVHALLFFTVETVREELRYDKYSDLMLDMGYFNTAEHYATEVLEIQGNGPFILNRLSSIFRAKNQIAAAEVIETALRRQLAYRLASRLLPQNTAIDTPGQTEVSLRIHQENRPLRDHEVRDATPEKILLDLLEVQPKNRMAFEYLMAYYLILHQQEKAVAQFGRLRDLGFTRLPRHYAEAALIALSKTRGQIDLQGWQIDPEVVKQYQAITQRYKEFRTNPQQAVAALAPEFGNSYFFYSIFSLSGVRP